MRNILIPVDPGHIQDFETTLELAEKLLLDGGKITLLSVVELIPTYVLAEVPGTVLDGARETVEEIIEGLLTGRGDHITAVVEYGHAANSILQYASENDCDLIIVASHKPGMMDYLIGSTAAAVVRKANCSVLVTR